MSLYHDPDRRRLQFRVDAYTGLDTLLALLPIEWQARRVAKKLLRGLWKEATWDSLQAADYVFTLPNQQSFQIISPYGEVISAAAVLVPIDGGKK